MSSLPDGQIIIHPIYKDLFSLLRNLPGWFSIIHLPHITGSGRKMMFYDCYDSQVKAKVPEI